MIDAPKPISTTELNLILAGPDRPKLYDICTTEDHAEFPFLLPGAVRISPHDLGALAGPAVIICQKGLKLSQGAAAILQARGHTATYLTGGIQAWATDGLPLTRADAIPDLWVTLAGPQAHLVRWMVAHLCATGKVVCVDPDVIAPVAEKFGAVQVDTAKDVLEHLDVVNDVLADLARSEGQHLPLLTHATQKEGAAFWSLTHRAHLNAKGA